MFHICGKKLKKLHVRGNSRCGVIPIWGTLRGTYVWCWISVELDILFVGSSVCQRGAGYCV